MIRRAHGALASAILLGLGAASATHAQLIPIRTVPVASGDQFLLMPSTSLGMGGVRYAVEDSVADAWGNPALGRSIGSSAFFGSPTFYGISRNGGGGRSFPLGAVFNGTTWFGGASVALQQIENADGDDPRFLVEPTSFVCCPTEQALSDRFGRNLYASGFVGRRLGDDWSVGVGASAAELGAMDGVDLLYAGAARIAQDGAIAEIRAGAVREVGQDRLALVVAHHRVSMYHDVTYFDGGVPGGRRVEANADESRTWAGQLAWDRSLTAPGWRVGAAVAMNHKSHPKIPNYSLQNIPRDPGTSWAYEFGVGVARTMGPSRFAVDVALQPIWSTTWQEASQAEVIASGGRLRVGDRSIENDFFFTNAVLRSGVSHRVGVVELQTGIEVRSYAYALEQVNRVELDVREQDESWIEWSPTFGTLFAFSALEVRYAVKLTTGTGRPGTLRNGPTLEGSFGSDADFIVAPEGPLTLQDARVITQQIAVSIPIR